MSTRMHPATVLPIMLATVGALVTGIARAANQTRICDGVTVPGTAAELAATPRADSLLELLALDVSGKVAADEEVYQRLIADQDLLATLFPRPGARLPYFPLHDGKTLDLRFDAATYPAVRAGTYDAWNCLNEWYGVVSSGYSDFDSSATLELKGIYDMPQLAPLYAALPGVLSVATRGFGQLGPQSSTCVLTQADAYHYFIVDNTGELGGCDGICAFSTVPGEPPRYHGSWVGAAAPVWSELASACFDGGSRRLITELSFAPERPTESDEVALTIQGLVATCGSELGDVESDPATGAIGVETFVFLGCLTPPEDVKFEVPLGPLAAGEHLVTVRVSYDSDGTVSAVEGAARLTVRSAAEAAAECPRGGPGATLLVPYFEVDVASPGGRTTIFSIGNASPGPERARVVLWTDRGFPSFGATVDLPADAIVNVNLRQLFASGGFPGAGGPGPDPPAGSGCAHALTDEERLDLVARHTGRPDRDGLCYGGPTTEPDLAVGYATVDVVNEEAAGDCPPPRFPGDPGYFEAGGAGLAGNRNVLWGDVLYVDGDGDAAQGIEAIAIPADGSLVDFADTFYRGWVGGGGADQRLPLGRLHRSRYLAGGGLGMTTDLIVWTEGNGAAVGAPVCGATPVDPASTVGLLATVRGQSGRPTGSFGIDWPERVERLHVGPPLLPTAGAFGQIDLSAGAVCTVCDPFDRRLLQSAVIPVFAADGRFSVGLRASRLDGSCP